MIAPVMRRLTAWLNDPDHGLNAQLLALPTETGDPVVRNVAIGDQVSNGQVAMGRPMKNLPMVGVYFAGMKDLEPTVAVSIREAQPAYIIRYHGEAGRAQEIVAESFHVAWAIQRVLHHFFQLATSAERTGGGIQILQCIHLEVTPVQGDVEGEPVTAGVLVVPQVADTAP